MPRYFFHIVSRKNPVRDAYGVELAGLEAAHWHAMRLVYRLREHAGEVSEDWVIAVGDPARLWCCRARYRCCARRTRRRSS